MIEVASEKECYYSVHTKLPNEVFLVDFGRVLVYSNS